MIQGLLCLFCVHFRGSLWDYPFLFQKGKSPLDLNGSNGLMSEQKQERRFEYAGLLREVPCQEGNERRQKHHHEERQAGNSGRMPDLWHENVQNRQGLGLLRHSPTELRKAGYSRYRDVQPFILRITHNKPLLYQRKQLHPLPCPGVEHFLKIRNN